MPVDSSQPSNAFGFTANAVNAPPKRAVSDESRTRTQPDTAPLNAPGEKPTKQVTQGPGSNNRGPMSGMEQALSSQADQIHPTGRLAKGQQSRG